MTLLLEARRSARRLSWASVVVAVFTSVAGTALFAVADPLLLAPLPYQRADQLVSIAPSFDLARRLKARELAAAAVELRRSPLFTALAHVRPGVPGEVLDAAPDGIAHYVVGPGFLRTLGVEPLRGRDVEAADAATSPASVVIREGLLARLEGGRASIGDIVSIGTNRVRVVGVVRDSQVFPARAALWSAATTAEVDDAVPALARMRQGSTLEQARSQFPGLEFHLLEDVIRPRQRLTLWLLLASACAMILIGGFQTLALQLTRLSSRSREFAIRSACGATSQRIGAELAVDAAVHGTVAVAATLLLLPPASFLASRLLVGSFPDWSHDGPDLRAFLYAGTAALCATTASTMIAALVFRRQLGRAPSLRQAGEWSLTPALRRARVVILAGQVAVSVAVLYGTVLALKNFATITSVSLGYDPRGVFGLIRPAAVPGSLAARVAHKALLEEASERVRRIPGVLDAAATLRRPLQAGAMKGTAQLPARPECGRRTVRTNYVHPRYFSTLSIPITAGRPMRVSESAAVIDARLAVELAACGGGIGDLLQVTSHRLPIVGVASTVLENLGGIAVEPQVYLPDVFGIAETVLVRTNGEAAALGAASEMIDAMMTDGGRVTVVVLQDDWARHAAPSRARAFVLGGLGVVAATLAAFGVAGNVSQSARLRRREIAVRLVLGASPGAVRKIFIVPLARVVAVGAVVGSAAGMGISRVVASYWHGATWMDGTTATGLACAVAGLGLILPALHVRRAITAAPLSLLHHD